MFNARHLNVAGMVKATKHRPCEPRNLYFELTSPAEHRQPHASPIESTLLIRQFLIALVLSLIALEFQNERLWRPRERAKGFKTDTVRISYYCAPFSFRYHGCDCPITPMLI